MGQSVSLESSVGVFTLDGNLVVQVWDAELERATGVSAQDACGQTIVALFPDLETRSLVKYFHRVFEEGVVEVLSSAFHHYLIPCPPARPSSRFEKMQQHVTIAPLLKANQTVGIIVTIEDVTARLDRERDLAEQLAHPNETNRLQAAKTLSEEHGVEPAKPLLGALKDRSWRVRRAAVEGLSKRAAPDAIEALLNSVRADHTNLALLNSALQVLALTDVDTLSPLVAFLQDDDADLRMQAALALGEQRDDRAVPALIEALNDSDANVRYHVIEALGKLRAVEATEMLIAIAEQRDFFLSFAAVEALGMIGDPRVATRIVHLLNDELLRDPAAALLGKLGDERTVAPLAALLNEFNSVTLMIARSLAALYNRYEQRYGEGEHIADLARQTINPTGAQHLLDALHAPASDDLRSLALVLGWLEGPAVEQALTHLLGNQEARREVVEALVRHGEGVTDLLLEQLDAELEIRKSAVIALGRIGDKRATPALIETLQADDQLIIPAADSLAKIGDPRAFEPLLELVGHEDASVRQASVGALNSLGVPEMPARVVRLLDDANPNVRESAIKIAGYFGYPECATLIIDHCRDEVERVRSAAIEHLPFFEDERVADLLAEALKSDTPKVRASAALSMAHIDSAKAVPPLLEAIKDDDSWVRYFAARSLGRHRAEEGADLLAELAENDKFNHVRIASLDALGQIGGERAVTTAASLVESGDPDLARAALTALGNVQHPDALPPLIKSSRSPDVSIRSSAVAALGERGGHEVTEHLQRAVMDEQPAVFETAITMLGKMASSEAIAGLIGLVGDPLRREAAITTLARADDAKVEQVARGLSHQKPEVRRGVVEALARMKREKASELLKSALQDSDAAVRLAAAGALGITLRTGPQAGPRF